MCAARLMTRSVVLGLAVGLKFLGLTATAPIAQTSPIGVLVDQILSLFPKVDGDVLEVQDGRELRHPRTGALLGKTEETVGRVRVEQVFEAYATGHVTQATDVKSGDRVRVSAGKVTLTVVPLVEGVKDALAEAA